ncbi:LPXTG cell wall anchor domain-containing protein [Alkaliphilus serpentinus]|uniref:LPXTG cell wall anchor domain-containing protein n=1 Tax=Alkaliphilus serpentinus TaxID=1482731 RepID=A0A833HPP1_9FIRM|nr:LPXTG cell wall anchor domain-containing protein [Alkaliphilus serpentinus]KAB3531078.1 LPXTG cell wall anchor domain-containing protein [Alkaliphilus serpentinus]
MNRKIIKSIANIVITLLVITCFTLAIRLQDTFALEVIGGEYGLKVELAQDNVATDNLNPGDTKESYMTISNIGEHPLPVYLNNRTIRETFGNGGGDLNDKLVLTITDQNDKLVYSGTVKGLNTPHYVGNIQPDTSVALDFKVDLPAEETTNEYQAASLTVKWIVSTTYKAPTDKPSPPTVIDNAEEVEELDDDETPLVTAKIKEEPEVVEEKNEEPEEVEEVEEVEEIEEVEIPSGVTTLPETGEASSNLFYGLGILFILVGIYINKRL